MKYRFTFGKLIGIFNGAIISVIIFTFFCRAQQVKRFDHLLERDVTYSIGDTLKADFYLPGNYKKQANPVLIFIDGFGTDFRKWEHYSLWAQFAASNGFVSIVYAAKQTSLRRNFTDLINFICSNSSRFFIDTSQIAVYAASGNVSVGLPMANDEHRVKAALIYYGSAKMQRFRLNLPVLIVRAGLDNVQLNKQVDTLLFDAMTNNAPYTVANLNTMLHAFENFSDSALSLPLLGKSLDFLKYNMKKEKQKDFSRNAQRILAMRELYNSNWQSAFTAFNKVIESDPVDNEAERQLGNICLELKEYEKAIGYYNSSLQHGNWRKGEIGLKKLLAYAKLDSTEAAVNEMRMLNKIGWFKEEDYTSNREFENVVRSASYKKFASEK